MEKSTYSIPVHSPTTAAAGRTTTCRTSNIRYKFLAILGCLKWSVVCFLCFLVCALLVSPLVLLSLTYAVFMDAPDLPHFTLVATSTTVHNISNYRATVDMDVGFAVENPNDNTMVYYDMNATALEYESGVMLGFSHVSARFDQPSGSKKTEWFSLQNMTVNSKNEKSGNSRFVFGLSGRTTYTGKTREKHDVPIKVLCGEVDILFSSNVNNAPQAVPSVFAPVDCHVRSDGSWSHASKIADILLAVSLTGLFVAVCCWSCLCNAYMNLDSL